VKRPLDDVDDPLHLGQQLDEGAVAAGRARRAFGRGGVLLARGLLSLAGRRDQPVAIFVARL